MKPISPVLPNSPEITETVFAKDQPPYLPLPAAYVEYEGGEISAISCYKLTLRERLRVIFSGRIWFEVVTFGKGLQPQKPTVYEPFKPLIGEFNYTHEI